MRLVGNHSRRHARNLRWWIKLSAAAAGGALTADATYLICAGGVKVSNAAGGALTASATALTVPLAVQFTKTSVNTTARIGPGAVRFISNGTGKMLKVNTTGTTWKYISLTSTLA